MLSLMEKTTYLQRLIYEASITKITDTHPSAQWNYDYQIRQAEQYIDIAVQELCQALVIAGKRAYRIEEI